MSSNIGLIGLAVMGENLSLNIASKGYDISVYNRTASRVIDFINRNGSNSKLHGHTDLKEFVHSLSSPRKIILLIKAGSAVDSTIEQLTPLLRRGDIIIDGGNSNFNDSSRRSKKLTAAGIEFIGLGVSGGEEGALNGPSLMPGCSKSSWREVNKIFKDIAAKSDDGEPCCRWLGESGSGHFVKMVHNGIEYAEMQILAEIYHIMTHGLKLSYQEQSEILGEWNKGDLNSYLMEISSEILKTPDPMGYGYLLNKIVDRASQKGMGKWTAITALEYGVAVPQIAAAITARAVSSDYDLRQQLAETATTDETVATTITIETLKDAVKVSRILAYAQGFALINRVSEEKNWQINLQDVAKIWRNGCIIRTSLLEPIADAVTSNPENFLANPSVNQEVNAKVVALREVVTYASGRAIPIPSFTGALTYHDLYSSSWLPANLIQAQRDYFGAHTFERTDQKRGEFFHHPWTGREGGAASTTYSI